MKSENLQSQISIAANLVIRSRIFLDAWWLSRGVEGRNRYHDFWDEYWEFWRFNEEALLCAFAVHICGLFEPAQKNTINLRRLMNLIAEDYTKCAVAPQFEAALDLARKVTILRSNLWAHRSGNIVYGEAFKKADVTADGLRQLTVLGMEIVNFMLRAEGLKEQEFTTLPITTLHRLASMSVT